MSLLRIFIGITSQCKEQSLPLAQVTVIVWLELLLLEGQFLGIWMTE